MNQHISISILFAMALALSAACSVRDINVKPAAEPSSDDTSWWSSFCSDEAQVETQPEVVDEAARCNDNLNATLWVQTSAEYEMLSRQAWLTAETHLGKALKDRKWTAVLEQGERFGRLPTAVILDVDETILDNSPYQAGLVDSGASFDLSTWAEWCEEKRAEAVPGALEFAQFANSKGVRVFYVTNRTNDIEDCTRQNLEALGFPMDPDLDTLLTKNERPEWGSDKGPRRTVIASEHRVLLVVGDQLGDFVDGSRGSLSARKAIMEQYQEWWGSKWVILPNPTYGHWESAVYGHERGLDPKAKAEKKFNALRR